MKKYISFFRIRLLAGLQYRAAAYSGMATQFVWGIMEVLMYAAFYRVGGEQFPMDFQALSSYIWLRQAFLSLFMLWILDNDIFSMITSGNIAYELARPIDIYDMWFVKNLSMRISKAALRCMPVLVFAALLPAPYGIAAPVGIIEFLLFLITCVLALFTVVAFCMLIYVSTFYTMNPLGIRMVSNALGEFLSGSLIPFPFFPKTIASLLSFLPFAGMQNLPFRIYGGDITGSEIFSGIALQIFWLAAMVIFGKLWTAHALKRVVVQGG
ncbi:MAG: ABC transporter permease [Clostridiales bacterium]|nr:ABC transporter permease [Clostridiales bacterium]